MPTSHPNLISPILYQVLIHQPRTVLEIGIGTGKYGALLYEYTDVWQQRAKREVWIDGIEIFKGYRNPLWQFYNRVIIGDATEVIDCPGLLEEYDMILMTEVLEHLTKDAGHAILAKCKQKAKVFLFSYTNSPQEAAHGNEHERHVSDWQELDFRFKAECVCGFDPTYLYRTGRNV